LDIALLGGAAVPLGGFAGIAIDAQPWSAASRYQAIALA
jgi:hypothetical protein